MNKRTKKIIAFILAIILGLSVISIIIPLFAAKAEAKEPDPITNEPGITQETDFDISQYNTAATYCVRPEGWYNYPAMVSKAASGSTITYTTGFVDKTTTVYKIKKLTATTCEIVNIGNEMENDTVVIPQSFKIYRLVNYGTIDNPTNYKGSVITEDGQEYTWDFTSSCTFKKDKDEEGNEFEYLAKGPDIRLYVETLQVTNVNTSFSESMVTAKNVVLPKNIRTIKANAFKNNQYIENIYAPGITEVSSNGFYNCKNLKNVVMPDITYIRDFAFYKCNKIEEFDLSDIYCIGKQAFYDCVSLKEINFSISLQELGVGAFRQCTGLKKVNIPQGISINTIPNECFYLCTSLESVDLPYEIICIAPKAFYNCNMLRCLDFRDTNLDTIESQAFWGCLRLSYVILPETLVSFKTDAFNNCTELRYVYFMSELTATQLKQIKASDLAKCSVVERDEVPPALYNKSTKTDLEGKTIHLENKTDFILHDVVDVTNVVLKKTKNEHNVAIKPQIEIETTKKFSTEFNEYKTYVYEFSIVDKGTYTVTATDILGNEVKYTIDYAPIMVTSIQAEKNIIGVRRDATAKINVTLGPDNAEYKDLAYKCEDPSIVTVDKNGNIRGIKAGETIVTVTATNGDDEKANDVSTKITVTCLPLFVCGDVDGDFDVTAADARLALRAAVGLEHFNALKNEKADIDKDGEITAGDARLILRAAVGLEDFHDRDY